MPRRLISVLAMMFFLAVPASSVQGERQITTAQINAVTQAIEDEIYDFDYQNWDFGYIGETIAPDEQQIRVYISPLEKDVNLGGPQKFIGYIIYKYMPFGEVLRLFWFTKGGLVVLGGNPEFGFPPSRPNYLTVYMDDDELCRDKQTWLKANFIIQLHPGAPRLREAAERQKERIGYSVRLDPSHRLVPAGRDPRCPAN
ncbi:MAG: hypothetical protein WA876_10565 [Candidatus Acidiferrales bacterium]